MYRLFFVALVIFSAGVFPELALAASPFAGGTDTFKSDLMTILLPVAGIGILAVGALCLFGKIQWYWFVGLVIGIVLVFGNDQIVSWIRGAFGV